MPTPPFPDEQAAIDFIFRAYNAARPDLRGPDEVTRNLTPARHLLARLGLPGNRREYVVITGSKGKGSVAAMTAKLLHSLGHRTGLVTSPHLTSYRQRFRVDGRAIDAAAFTRILSAIAPEVEAVQQNLSAGQYLSPQAIFLALALIWFDEQDVNAAVIEVGRGGRFDDNALVPNTLSLFTPIFLEHTRYLGDTVERIAWHKAGIIKPGGYAYSLPQTPGVMATLRREADEKDATFEWLAPQDTGEVTGHATTSEGTPGLRVRFPRYGEVTLPTIGHYQAANASLAIWAAGNTHARLDSPITHGSSAYVQRIRAGLESAVWPGRAQVLATAPLTIIDGAITPPAAQNLAASVRLLLRPPVVSVLAVPEDRDSATIYATFAPLSDAMILTESASNRTIRFPPAEVALQMARDLHRDVRHLPTVAEAIEAGRGQAGPEGTVLLVLAQPAIGDTMAHFGLSHTEL